MAIYKITGVAFHFDTLSELMEYVMQQSDDFRSSLDHRLIVKKQECKVVVLYRVRVDIGNKEIRLVRARRS